MLSPVLCNILPCIRRCDLAVTNLSQITPVTVSLFSVFINYHLEGGRRHVRVCVCVCEV